MRKSLAAFVLACCAQAVSAVPVTLSLSADFAAGAGQGTSTPYHFATSFAIDSNAAITDIVTSQASTLYGYSRSSLTGFGFDVGTVSYRLGDIRAISLTPAHSADFYLDAPIESGAFTALWMFLLPAGGLGVGLGSVYTTDADDTYLYFDRRMFVGSTIAPLSIVSNVPEPGSWALLTAGVGALAWRRRRR